MVYLLYHKNTYGQNKKGEKKVDKSTHVTIEREKLINYFEKFLDDPRGFYFFMLGYCGIDSTDSVNETLKNKLIELEKDVD